MEFRLKDYKGNIKKFNIIALENVNPSELNIIYTVQSGDEVIYIFIRDELLEICDSCDLEDRKFSILDTLYPISLSQLERLNKKDFE